MSENRGIIFHLTDDEQDGYPTVHRIWPIFLTLFLFALMINLSTPLMPSW